MTVLLGQNSDGSDILGIPLDEHPTVIQIQQDLLDTNSAIDDVASDLANHNHDGQYAPIGQGNGSGNGSSLVVVREVKPQGVYPDHFDGSNYAFKPRHLNQIVGNTNTGIALNNYLVTLPAGTYWVNWWNSFISARYTWTGLYSPSLGVWVDRPQYLDFTDSSQNNVDFWIRGGTLLTFASTQTIAIYQGWAYSLPGYENISTGVPRNQLAEECYSWMNIFTL